ncbi:hypothetical protein CK510_03755 [Brunnivagina elsteri CCALA 953]|uniref:Uncharacterized protein n=1 Tax=Brunnivagina elsteri CCALA 953 TaxID=987040 RepID=A0A2A2TNW3_9CYAN|nr:hypothetical protein CK510_03755 [Calothrix elsteri CCALA 953]
MAFWEVAKVRGKPFASYSLGKKCVDAERLVCDIAHLTVGIALKSRCRLKLVISSEKLTTITLR